jgi:hypothetical protein
MNTLVALLVSAPLSLAVAAVLLKKYTQYKVISLLTDNSTKLCELITDAEAPIPADFSTETYDAGLTTALLGISNNTSKRNCADLPLPSQFTRMKQLKNGKDSLVAVAYSNDTIACVAFTGTYDRYDWIADFNFKLESPSAYNFPDVKLHAGYYSDYLDIREELMKWWKNLGFSTLLVTGFSMGGALGSICALDFSKEADVVHYSFASPRCGDPVFAKEYNERVKTGYRIFNTEDIVPAFPPAEWRGEVYEHAGFPVCFTMSLATLTLNHTRAYEIEFGNLKG